MTLTHDPIPGIPAGQDPNGEPLNPNQPTPTPASGSEQTQLAPLDVLTTDTDQDVDRQLGKRALKWDTDSAVADTPVLAPKQRRFPRKTVAGATAAILAGGIYLATSGGNDKPEANSHGPVATSVPTAGKNSTPAPANTTPSVSPSSLPSLGAGEHAPHTGLDITDLTSLPADIPTEIVKVHNWEVHIPTSLVDPAEDPELFAKEVLTLVAVADSVPADSALFTKCMNLLGHSDPTDRFTVDMRAQNQHVKDLTSPYSNDPPQLVFFSDGAITTTYDASAGTTTLTTPNGKSIWFAADPFPIDQWQDSAAKQPGEDQAVFPNGQLAQYIISSTKSAGGKLVVSKIDTGASETFK